TLSARRREWGAFPRFPCLYRPFLRFRCVGHAIDTRVRAPAALSPGVLTLAFGACGGDSSACEEPTPGPAPSSVPEPDGRSIDELIADSEPGNDIVASPAGAVYTPGDKRFAFGLFRLDRSQLTDAEVAIYAQSERDKAARGPFPARTESL